MAASSTTFIALCTHGTTVYVGSFPTYDEAVLGIREFVRDDDEFDTRDDALAETYAEEDGEEEPTPLTGLFETFLTSVDDDEVVSLYENLKEEIEALGNFDIVEHTIGEIFPLSKYEEWHSDTRSLEKTVSATCFGREYFFEESDDE